MKNRAAVALGKKGGLARAKKLTRQERSDSAKKAVLARWAKKKPKGKVKSARGARRLP